MNTTMDANRVTNKYFYFCGDQNESAYAVDRIYLREDGVEVGCFSKKTIEELSSNGREIKIGDTEVVTLAIENYHRSAPKIIPNDHYLDMLCALPPMGFTHHGHSESFKFEEFTAMNITDIYARVGNTCFHMKDKYVLSHDEILQKIVAFLDAA